MLQGILPHNPAGDLSYPKLEKQVPQFLSAGDFERILDFLSERITEADGLPTLMLFLFLGVLGLRISTIRQLNIGDVDSPTLVYFLDCYLATLPDSREALFLSKRGQRISERALQSLVRDVGKACGLNIGLHPHLFRHTAATHLCQVTDIHVTREVLGHWRENNTRRYVHLDSNIYSQYMKRHPYMGQW
jgi:site-specific recombinase XerC